MQQSPLMSFIESALNTASGFLISLLAQYLFLPFIGVPISLHQNLLFAVFMTFVSVARSYGWRRLMEKLHIRRPLSPFMQAVIAERYRQIEQEGWSIEHDDDHRSGELARAGASYALSAAKYDWGYDTRQQAPGMWPWSRDWWKPAGVRRDLVKAGALIIAEGEKHDRGRRVPRQVSLVPGPVYPRHPRRGWTGAPIEALQLAHGKSPSEQGGSSV